MSTFGGKLEEIPDISIDRFNGINLESSAFFLTHCHSDHMEGIYYESERNLFINNLRNRKDVYLYTSPQTKAILNSWMKDLKDFVIGLDIYERNYIDIPDKDITLAVSLLPAGHCPGSVMFLFETDKKILYTGDIRLKFADLQKYKLLYDSTNALKKIDHIYLDTTFFSKSFMSFPSCDKSIQEICGVIKEWISKSSRHTVSLIPAANYGSEALFVELYRTCGMPIHVHKDKYNIYKHFPEMDCVFTTNNKLTQLHNSCEGYNHICRNGSTLLKVKPCALSWAKTDYTKGIQREEDGILKICYSAHSSYNELVDILKFLKPSKITPCVLPKETNTEELYLLINEIMKELQSEVEEFKDSEVKEFDGIIDWTKKEGCNSLCTNNSDSESSCNLSFLDSPEMERKRFKPCDKV